MQLGADAAVVAVAAEIFGTDITQDGSYVELADVIWQRQVISHIRNFNSEKSRSRGSSRKLLPIHKEMMAFIRKVSGQYDCLLQRLSSLVPAGENEFVQVLSHQLCCLQKFELLETSAEPSASCAAQNRLHLLRSPEIVRQSALQGNAAGISGHLEGLYALVKAFCRGDRSPADIQNLHSFCRFATSQGGALATDDLSDVAAQALALCFLPRGFAVQKFRRAAAHLARKFRCDVLQGIVGNAVAMRVSILLFAVSSLGVRDGSPQEQGSGLNSGGRRQHVAAIATQTLSTIASLLPRGGMATLLGLYVSLALCWRLDGVRNPSVEALKGDCAAIVGVLTTFGLMPRSPSQSSMAPKAGKGPVMPVEDELRAFDRLWSDAFHRTFCQSDVEDPEGSQRHLGVGADDEQWLLLLRISVLATSLRITGASAPKHHSVDALPRLPSSLAVSCSTMALQALDGESGISAAARSAASSSSMSLRTHAKSTGSSIEEHIDTPSWDRSTLKPQEVDVIDVLMDTDEDTDLQTETEVGSPTDDNKDQVPSAVGTKRVADNTPSQQQLLPSNKVHRPSGDLAGAPSLDGADAADAAQSGSWQGYQAIASEQSQLRGCRSQRGHYF